MIKYVITLPDIESSSRKLMSNNPQAVNVGLLSTCFINTSKSSCRALSSIDLGTDGKSDSNTKHMLFVYLASFNTRSQEIARPNGRGCKDSH